MMTTKGIFGLLFVAICFLLSADSLHSIEVFVSPQGKPKATGTKQNPFDSLHSAQRAVRELNEPVTIIIQEGRYEISNPLVFTEKDSGTSENLILWQAEDGATVTVSGGRRIMNWKNIKDNHWVAVLPDVQAGSWYFRQLWADEQRLTRARIPNDGFLHTAGPLTPFKSGIRSGISQDIRVDAKDMKTALLARCGFKFNDQDIQEWDNWQEAEILTYHKWECSWQTIREIDQENKLVYMNSPCRYPVGRFGGQMRYRIENIPAALDAAGEWYLDGRKGELHYLAHKEEDPNAMEIVAPYVSKLLDFKGAKATGKTVSHIRFAGIDFKHAKYELGIYDITPDWPAEIRKHDPSFPENPRPGYTDSQAAPRSGQAVKFTDATDIAFEKCRFNHLGAWAVHFNWRSHRIALKSCEIFDVGGGAIQMGNPVRLVEKAGIPEAWAPSYNTVTNCWIHRAGQVHPSAVGVMIAQAHHNIVEHCEISDLSYSGISNGWTWGRQLNYTHDNRIANNYIHHVAQKLGDAAGLYSLGNNPGTIYFENHLGNIVKGKGVHGVVDAMGFDEGSNGIRIERNVVGNISGKFTSFNRNGPKDHTWIGNSFDTSKVEYPVFPHDPKYDSPQLTVAADFLYEGTPSGRDNRRWVVSKTQHELADGHYGLIVIGKKAGAFLNIGGNKHVGRILLESEDELQTGSQNHIAFTYDGDLLKLFVNGKPSGSLKVGKPRTIGKGKLAIGRRSDGHLTLKHGARNAWIYNRPLSSEEIQSLANYETEEITRKGLTFEWKAQQKKQQSLPDFETIKNRAGLKTEYRELLKGKSAELIHREPSEWCNVWIPNNNRNDYPRVLLVGDSIAQGYYNGVAKKMSGKAYCARLITSASVADPMFALQLRSVIEQYPFDVIHFNNSLHGLNYTEEEYKREYEKALTLISKALPKAKIIIALSTPTKTGGSKKHLIARMEARNKIALELAKQNKLKITDLFTPMHGHPEYYRDDYHFHRKAIAIQADLVAQAITEILEQKIIATEF